MRHRNRSSLCCSTRLRRPYSLRRRVRRSLVRVFFSPSRNARGWSAAWRTFRKTACDGGRAPCDRRARHAALHVRRFLSPGPRFRHRRFGPRRSHEAPWAGFSPLSASSAHRLVARAGLRTSSARLLAGSLRRSRSAPRAGPEASRTHACEARARAPRSPSLGLPHARPRDPMPVLRHRHPGCSTSGPPLEAPLMSRAMGI